LLAILTAVGILANVVGALCIIVPCVAWLGFMAWALTDPA